MDCVFVVPSSSASVSLKWRAKGLQVTCQGVQLSIYGASGNALPLDLIPWETCAEESPLNLNKLLPTGEPNSSTFAIVTIEKTVDVSKWNYFKSRIDHKGECYMTELSDINDDLVKESNKPNNEIIAFMKIYGAKQLLMEYYSSATISRALYESTVCHWDALLYMLAPKILVMNEVDNLVLNKVTRFTLDFLGDHHD